MVRASIGLNNETPVSVPYLSSCTSVDINCDTEKSEHDREPTFKKGTQVPHVLSPGQIRLASSLNSIASPTAGQHFFGIGSLPAGYPFMGASAPLPEQLNCDDR